MHDFSYIVVGNLNKYKLTLEKHNEIYSHISYNIDEDRGRDLVK